MEKKPQETLQQYVGDMLAIEQNINQMASRQAGHADKMGHPEAVRLVQEIEQLSQAHITRLEQHLEEIGGSGASGVKRFMTGLGGALEGVVSGMRDETASKALRDDYIVLGVATIGHSMLHTTGLALRSPGTAQITDAILNDWTPIVMRINQIMPDLVVEDLIKEGNEVDRGAIEQARQHTQEVWRRRAA